MDKLIADKIEAARNKGIAEGRADQNGAVHRSVDKAKQTDLILNAKREHGDDSLTWPDDVKSAIDALTIKA